MCCIHHTGFVQVSKLPSCLPSAPWPRPLSSYLCSDLPVPALNQVHLLGSPRYFSFIALLIIDYLHYLFNLGLPVRKSLEDRHHFCPIHQCTPRAWHDA